MHAVHCILVNLDGANVAIDEREATLSKLAEDNQEPEYINDIREYAEKKTEDFQDDVFDWRETDTAGRWSEEYPCNVVTGLLEKERFLQLFDEFSAKPEEEAKDYLNRFTNENGGKSMQLSFDELAKLDSMQTFRLKQAIKLLDGDYTFDSHFWSAAHYVSRLSDNEKAEVHDNSKDYALVFFDYHN